MQRPRGRNEPYQLKEQKWAWSSESEGQGDRQPGGEMDWGQIMQKLVSHGQTSDFILSAMGSPWRAGSGEKHHPAYVCRGSVSPLC